MSQSFSSAINAFLEAGRKKSDSLHVQAGRFAFVGAISAGVDLAITWLLQIGLGLVGRVGARTIGWGIGTLLAYFLNRRWTFGASASTRRFTATMLLYGITYLANITIYRRAFPLFDDHLNSNLALLLAFILAQGTATLVNFLVQRWMIFRKN